jgi:hypothetical protein
VVFYFLPMVLPKDSEFGLIWSENSGSYTDIN